MILYPKKHHQTSNGCNIKELHQFMNSGVLRCLSHSVMGSKCFGCKLEGVGVPIQKKHVISLLKSCLVVQISSQVFGCLEYCSFRCSVLKVPLLVTNANLGKTSLLKIDSKILLGLLYCKYFTKNDNLKTFLPGG